MSNASPVYIVLDEFSPCVLWRLIIGLIVVPLTFFSWCVWIYFWGVGAIVGNEYGSKEKITLRCSGEVKRK